MKRFCILLAIIAVTAVALAMLTPTIGGVSETTFLGMPVVAVMGDSAAFLAVGAGAGVLVVGLAGVGVVSITLYGAGILFATGQLSAGLIAFGQLGVGLVFFFGQVGGGFIGFGQMVLGALVGGQIPVGFKAADFLHELNRDLDSVLTFR